MKRRKIHFDRSSQANISKWLCFNFVAEVKLPKGIQYCDTYIIEKELCQLLHRTRTKDLESVAPRLPPKPTCTCDNQSLAKINKLKKMVGSNGTLMTMRLVRSKLRKREESSVSPVTATNVEAAPPSSNHNNHHNHHQNNNSSSTNNHHHSNHHSSSNNHSSQLENGYSVPTPVAFRQSPSSVWVFPPLPPQPNLYHYNANSQDALVHNEKTGFKGLKRQLSGRFKRLVSRKSHEPAPAIPPELKPQLKTIYVY